MRFPESEYVEVHDGSDWHIVRVAYLCDAGIMLESVPRTLTMPTTVHLSRSLLAWSHVAAARGVVWCQACDGTGWGAPGTGEGCGTCHGLARLVPVPWTDATPGPWEPTPVAERF